jgi:hypothetical protein
MTTRTLYIFSPQEDITAYELAVIVSKCDVRVAANHGVALTYEQLQEMGEMVRHFGTVLDMQ